MTSFEALDKGQRVRASIERDVQAICTEACHSLGLDLTAAAMDLVFDVFLYKMNLYAEDLEKFAKHAKRSMITSDDCRLLTRRNSTLTAHINSLKLPGTTSKESVKRHRTTASTSSPKSARLSENLRQPLDNVRKNINTTSENFKQNVNKASMKPQAAENVAAEVSMEELDAVDLTVLSKPNKSKVSTTSTKLQV